MAADPRVQRLATAIKRVFPKLSSTASRMLAGAIVRFVDRATEKQWSLENEFDLSGLKIDRSTPVSRAAYTLRRQAYQ